MLICNSHVRSHCPISEKCVQRSNKESSQVNRHFIHSPPGFVLVEGLPVPWVTEFAKAGTLPGVS